MAPTNRGFSMIDLLVSMSVIAILSMIVVPQLLMAYDRGRQRRSLGDMRNLSTALSTYQLDHGGLFPSSGAGLLALQPDYYAGVPDDGWGTSYLYVGINSGCAYLLLGMGSDALIGPNPPDPWIGDSFEPDIWLSNGAFLQAPGLPDGSSELTNIIAESCG
ncbi:MAG TPA: type II secretion system protein GspG [Acidobacteriota bacterium]|nr:type II secretion system protein GspG [Acidobacteriota bacterium]